MSESTDENFQSEVFSVEILISAYFGISSFLSIRRQIFYLTRNLIGIFCKLVENMEPWFSEMDLSKVVN
jgi:hypothetical protein